MIERQIFEITLDKKVEDINTLINLMSIESSNYNKEIFEILKRFHKRKYILLPIYNKIIDLLKLKKTEELKNIFKSWLENLILKRKYSDIMDLSYKASLLEAKIHLRQYRGKNSNFLLRSLLLTLYDFSRLIIENKLQNLFHDELIWTESLIRKINIGFLIEKFKKVEFLCNEIVSSKYYMSKQLQIFDNAFNLYKRIIRKIVNHFSNINDDTLDAFENNLKIEFITLYKQVENLSLLS